MEEHSENSNSENTIDAVSTEDANKEISEKLEALHTEDDSKYAISENMAHVKFEEVVKDTSSEFDICNPK